MFAFSNLTPKQMNETITLKLVGENGAESDTVTYSIYQYCKNMLGKASTSASTKRLIVDMLNYGAQAKTVFVNDGVADPNDPVALLATQYSEFASADRAFTKYTQNDSTYEDIARWYSAYLFLNDSIDVHFVFTTTESDVSDWTAEVECGAGRKYTIDGSRFVADGVVTAEGKDKGRNRFVVAVNELSASELGQLIKVTLEDADSNKTGAITYSIESYAKSKESDAKLGDLVKSIMKYIDSVIASLED